MLVEAAQSHDGGHAVNARPEADRVTPRLMAAVAVALAGPLPGCEGYCSVGGLLFEFVRGRAGEAGLFLPWCLGMFLGYTVLAYAVLHAASRLHARLAGRVDRKSRKA
jgi:hypothetical protein